MTTSMTFRSKTHAGFSGNCNCDGMTGETTHNFGGVSASSNPPMTRFEKEASDLVESHLGEAASAHATFVVA